MEIQTETRFANNNTTLNATDWFDLLPKVGLSQRLFKHCEAPYTAFLKAHPRKREKTLRKGKHP